MCCGLRATPPFTGRVGLLGARAPSACDVLLKLVLHAGLRERNFGKGSAAAAALQEALDKAVIE